MVYIIGKFVSEAKFNKKYDKNIHINIAVYRHMSQWITSDSLKLSLLTNMSAIDLMVKKKNFTSLKEYQHW